MEPCHDSVPRGSFMPRVFVVVCASQWEYRLHSHGKSIHRRVAKSLNGVGVKLAQPGISGGGYATTSLGPLSPPLTRGERLWSLKDDRMIHPFYRSRLADGHKLPKREA